MRLAAAEDCAQAQVVERPASARLASTCRENRDRSLGAITQESIGATMKLKAMTIGRRT
jgi:hypothetical protein